MKLVARPTDAAPGTILERKNGTILILYTSTDAARARLWIENGEEMWVAGHNLKFTRQQRGGSH